MISLFINSDFTILKKLSKDGNICIIKPDKGCSVLLLNKANYHQKAYDIINDRDKFEEIHGEERKLLIKLKDKQNNALRSLKAKRNITE